MNACAVSLAPESASISGMLDAYRGKRILITGGRGFIGAALSRDLSAVPCGLTILDRSGPEAWMPSGAADISFIAGDIRQRSVWDEVLPHADVVFHLAQQEYVQCDPLLDFSLNAEPAIHLCEACREKGLQPLVVFSSSVNLYGQARTLPVAEEVRDEPLIPWAVHKQAAEGYLHAYARKYGLRAVILRLANVYGPTPRHDVMFRPAVNAAIRDAMRGEPLKLYPNAHCIRDYVYIDDVVRSLLLAGGIRDEANGDIYNIGSAAGLTIAEAWEQILDSVSRRLSTAGSIVRLAAEVEPFAMRNFIADITRFGNLTGWKPAVSFRSGVEKTVEHILSLSAKS